MTVLTDPWRRSVLLAVGLVVAGGAGIAAAWSGAAATLSVPEQVAFAVSGGFGGIALVGAGLALLAVQGRRRAAAAERRQLDRFAGELHEIADLLAARVSRPTRRRRTLRAR